MPPLLPLLALVAPAAEPPTYEDHVDALASARDELASALREAECEEERLEVLASAREVLTESVIEDLLPSWFGTRWHLEGASQRPGRGSIACGYLVSTVLRDAGLQVERVQLAQQPSEYIVRTLVPEERIWRFVGRPASEVLDRVEAEGPGVYLVGLDTHVALLVHRGAGETEVCHASRTPPAWVRCEDAESAWSFAHSGYHVVGHAFEDDVVRAWLEGEEVPTVAWTPPEGWVWNPAPAGPGATRD